MYDVLYITINKKNEKVKTCDRYKYVKIYKYKIYYYYYYYLHYINNRINNHK